MEFVTSVAATLAWPVTIVVVVLLLRNQVRGLIDALNKRVADNLTQVTGPGFSATFAEEVRDVQRSLEEGTPAPDNTSLSATSQLPPGRPDADEYDFARMVQLAKDAPRGAVLQAFIVLEEALRDAVEAAVGAGRIRSPGVSRLVSARANLDVLRRADSGKSAINPELYSTIRSLIDLRNQAAHSRELQLSPADAEAYVLATNRTVDAIRMFALTLKGNPTK